MQFLSLQPFIPSGNNFEAAKNLFVDLGFNITWDAGNYMGFEKDECKFILQKYDNKAFAENLMINVRVNDIQEFRTSVIEKQIPEKYGIRIGEITHQPYGKEVNLIDMAGVCWHFVE